MAANADEIDTPIIAILSGELPLFHARIYVKAEAMEPPANAASGSQATLTCPFMIVMKQQQPLLRQK
ncbi:hypothetical protein JCM10914_2501 [Paenibacillus sp. JCM 10914]|nr:hypothetical protein JCM10914_2501 [Paenibacillus sp. JCM 10914]